MGLLRQGAEAWNEWRQKNARIQIDLTNANLSMANLSMANLRGADLMGAKLIGTDLIGADLIGADLTDADLHEANLSRADLIGADLRRAKLIGADLRVAKLSRADLMGADLMGADLRATILSGANLREANLLEAKLSGANLRVTNLRQANLSRSDLREADLSRANLSKANLTEAKLIGTDLTDTQALGTNFTGAKLTRACLENWNINSRTLLEDVVCDYVYLQHHQQDRCPSSGNFISGEFVKLFQEALSTFDLVFPSGIDWLAFAQSFKQVEVENAGIRLAIRSMESKGDGGLVVRVIVACDVDKARIQSALMAIYEAAKTAPLSGNSLVFNFGQLPAGGETSKEQEDLNRLFYLLKRPSNEGRLLRLCDRRQVKLRKLSRPRIIR